MGKRKSNIIKAVGVGTAVIVGWYLLVKSAEVKDKDDVQEEEFAAQELIVQKPREVKPAKQIVVPPQKNEAPRVVISDQRHARPHQIFFPKTGGGIMAKKKHKKPVMTIDKRHPLPISKNDRLQFFRENKRAIRFQK